MSDFLGIHGTALALREKRLQLLSANIANADTPHYQAQDLDFTTALRSALQPGGTVTGSAGGPGTVRVRQSLAPRPSSHSWRVEDELRA